MWDAVIVGNNRYKVGCVVGLCYIIVGYYPAVGMWVNRAGVPSVFEHVTDQLLRDFAISHAADTCRRTAVNFVAFNRSDFPDNCYKVQHIVIIYFSSATHRLKISLG
jgi:hypothetical protein